MSEALEAIIEGNAAARADLMDAIDALPAERRSEGWYGPRQWSVQDVLAHLARWQEGWSHALRAVATGERPAVPGYEPNRDDPDAADDAYNADSVAEMRGQSWEAVMARLRAAREAHDEAIRGLSVLDPDRYAEGRTPYRLADAAHHDHEHIEAIRSWRREQGV
ncbi:MAG: DinB family protein [Chloroflexi bacterium]|nr:DinB family protein [Chloroflexota bacterium]